MPKKFGNLDLTVITLKNKGLQFQSKKAVFYVMQ